MGINMGQKTLLNDNALPQTLSHRRYVGYNALVTDPRVQVHTRLEQEYYH